MMAGITGKNTKPELLIRKGLHRCGFRYRIHYKGLPGKPDIVLPKHKVIILVHGCFWHSHGCHLFKLPTTRTEFWKRKLEANTLRDSNHLEFYRAAGWRVCTVWECAIKGKYRIDEEQLIDRLADWVRSGQFDIELPSKS